MNQIDQKMSYDLCDILTRLFTLKTYLANGNNKLAKKIIVRIIEDFETALRNLPTITP